MHLLYHGDVLANAATTIDAYDGRNPKAVRGIVVALRDLSLDRAALYFEGRFLTDVSLISKLRSGDQVTVDWCVIASQK